MSDTMPVREPTDDSSRSPTPTADLGPWYDEITETFWVVSEDGPTSALQQLAKFECEEIFPICYGWKVTIEPVSIRWAEDDDEHDPEEGDRIEVASYADECTVQAWQIKPEGR
jgi:hypothetical protein